jgi:hypothetical protein
MILSVYFKSQTTVYVQVLSPTVNLFSQEVKARDMSPTRAWTVTSLPYSTSAPRYFVVYSSGSLHALP